MGRGLSSANLAAAMADHRREVVLVKLEFDTPVYANSSYSTITFDGNDYLGVGHFGGVEASESEALAPAPFRLKLNGLDATFASEAVDAGTFGDLVTAYLGFQNDDGTLVDDPEVLGRGYTDSMIFARGTDDNSITLIAQNALSVLDKKAGGRFSHEDQVERYSGDNGLKFVTDTNYKQLVWGRRNPQVGGAGSGGGRNGRERRFDER